MKKLPKKENDKKTRVLRLFEYILENEKTIRKEYLEDEGISSKEFDLDLEFLEYYFKNKSLYYEGLELEKSGLKTPQSHVLRHFDIDTSSQLTKNQVYAVAKILIESRAFQDKEITMLVNILHY
ncbi:MAG: hypothetical protein ACRCWQ_08645 [Bacilli bacterium]